MAKKKEISKANQLIAASKVPVKVTITSNDFKKGVFTLNKECALARALKRKFPESDILVSGVSFDIDGITYPLTPNESTCIQERCVYKDNLKPLTIKIKPII